MKLNVAAGWSKVWHNVVVPMAVRGGLRNGLYIPLDRAHLQSRFGYDEEPAIKAAVDRIKRHTMTSFERLASLWQQVRYLDRFDVPGAFVECGVWKGGSTGLMALAHRATRAVPTRELHLFDSFEGLPEPDAVLDDQQSVDYAGAGGGELRSVGKCVGTLDENRELMERLLGYPTDLLRYHVGWFQDTIPRDAPALGSIALLRLDGDWYESTRICLEHLYDKVSRGGVVVIDDYGHYEGCRKAVDEFLQRRKEPVLLSHIDYTGRYWIKPS
jgi:hypothetical protein